MLQMQQANYWKTKKKQQANYWKSKKGEQLADDSAPYVETFDLGLSCRVAATCKLEQLQL